MRTNPYDTISSQQPDSSQPQPGYEAWHDSPTRQRLSGLAVASLILAILCVTAPIGVILGVAALFLIARSGGRLTGRGLALTGVVIGLALSLLWTMILVGALLTWRVYQSQFTTPTVAIMQAVESGSFDQVRAKMSGSVTLSDEQLEAFRARVRAELGAFQRGVTSFGDFLSASSAVGPVMQSSQGPAEAMGAIAPVLLHYEQGTAVVWIKANQADMSILNLMVGSKSGTLVYLFEPSAPALPIAPKPIAPIPPVPPATPLEAEKPADPKPASGG